MIPYVSFSICCSASSERSSFDEALPKYGTRHGVLAGEHDPAEAGHHESGAGVVVSSPLLWADALDMMMAKIAASGLDLSRLAAIAGSAQQHGSVYLNAAAAPMLGQLDADRAPSAQLAGGLSRAVSPIQPPRGSQSRAF